MRAVVLSLQAAFVTFTVAVLRVQFTVICLVKIHYHPSSFARRMKTKKLLFPVPFTDSCLVEGQ